MIIRKEHAAILLELLKDRISGGKIIPAEKMNDDAVEELMLSGLIREATPYNFILTYHGSRMAEIIERLTTQIFSELREVKQIEDDEKIILDHRNLPSPEQWEDDFRFIGSEIINLLDAAEKDGKVGPEGEAPLLKRGLAARVRWRKRKTEAVELTEEGKQILDIYRYATPLLEIEASLAETLRKLPKGPTEASNFNLLPHEKHALESMRLIAYSQPESEFAALTALGQAVQQTLKKGGFALEGIVLDEIILNNIARIADGEELEESSLSFIQALGYVDENLELLPAGELALEVLRIYKNGPQEITWSFAIEDEEAEILQTIYQLWQKAENNPQEIPTFERLKDEMIERKIKEYKELVEKYGRKLKEQPRKKQEIAENFQEAKNYREWYENNFDLRAMLHSLESFNLLTRKIEEDSREIFYLTEYGEEVRKDQEKNLRTISSEAVKSITLTRKEFSVPNAGWCKESKKEGLLGTFEATESGEMYASLAEKVERTPFMTAYELKVFKAMPLSGMTEEELYAELQNKIAPEWFKWALDRLEARQFIERLSDGNVVKTEAGSYLDLALAGVPEGMGMPVNPIIFSVIKGLAAVGTLYEKEKKIRVAPAKIVQAIKISGLDRERFQNAAEAARVAGFIGRNSVNEVGQMLLKAMEVINSNRPNARYVEF